MLRLFLLCTCFFSAGFLPAQNRRNTRVVEHTGKDPEKWPEKGRNELLVDKNNTTDPKVQGLMKYASGLGISALLTGYPVVGFSPVNSFELSALPVPVSEIKIIDARFDVAKLGFLPVGYELQKKGYARVGVQINNNLADWLKQAFVERSMITDSTSKRKLVIVIRRCTLGNSAKQLYTVSKPALLTTLQYQFDIFTSSDFGYYPQKKIKGSFTTGFNRGNAYTILTDSLLSVLHKELFKEDFSAKEKESNWQSPVDFNDYYNNRMRAVTHFEKIPAGIYADYTDFLEGAPISDSVQMTVKYNNYDRISLYACQLVAFKEGQHISSNKAWGYFDGTSLYLNTGNGFYIKLLRAKDDFVFFNLNSIKEERIKSNVLESIQIGSTPYLLLKDYAKAYALSFQLDLETGGLF